MAILFMLLYVNKYYYVWPATVAAPELAIGEPCYVESAIKLLRLSAFKHPLQLIV